MGVFGWLKGKTHESTPPAPDSIAGLAAAPPGFAWHSFREPGVSVLRPDGWHVHEARTQHAFTGCVSKENIPEHGSFRTGLTLQHLRQAQEVLGIPASAFAVRLYEQSVSKPDNTMLLAQPGPNLGVASTYLFRYRRAPEVTEPIVIHQFIVAHDSKGDVYIFTFESPEANWEESWSIGETIFDQIVLHRIMG